ncbi:unnamed protein product [Orchesella dallaii]|uniref:C2H2-type domain-containing protein n=1 Tax=Orchesella dallaii TaxID=48710 RepID=A0ABP1Q5S0_9HEXA
METQHETSGCPDMTEGVGPVGDVCVFCLNSTDTRLDVAESFVKSEVRCDDGQYMSSLSANTSFTEECTSSSSSPSCGLLATEMKVIFIVRKLLSLSEHQCVEMLETFGNPSSWLKVCKFCVQTVDKAFWVHKTIIRLEKELEALKEAATRRIRASDEYRRKRSRSEITEATNNIRRYVLNGPDVCDNAFSRPRELDEEIKEEIDTGEVCDEVDVMCNESLDSLSDPDYIPDGAELEFEYEETEEYTGAAVHENVSRSAIRKKSQSRKTRGNKRKERRDVSPVSRADRQSCSRKPKEETFDKVNVKNLHLVEEADDDADEVVIKIEDGELKSYYRCSRCSYKSYRRPDLVRHLKNVHGCYSRNLKTLKKDKRKICVLCEQVFTNISSFHTHCINQHKMMSCNKCPRLFSTVSTLHVHQKKHTTTPTSVVAISSKFSCPHCNFSTKSLSYLNRHRRCIHGEMTKKMVERSLKQNQCNECKKTFENMEIFKKHCISDHQMIQCPKCPMLFPTLTRFKSHERRHHQDAKSKGRILQCKRCDYSSTALVNLNRHVRDVHWETGDRVRLSLMRKSKCSQCQKIYESMDALRTHCLEVHGMKECFKCPKVFVTEELLGAHLRRFHGTIKWKPKLKINLDLSKENTSTYKCPHCHFFCTAEPRLNDHIRIVHKELAAIISGKFTADNLKCEKCSKEFPSIEELIQHKIDEHEMVKCEKCLRVFPYVGYLELHQKRYHSEDAAAGKESWNWTTKVMPVTNDSSTTENTDCVPGSSKMEKPKKSKNLNCTKCHETFLNYRDLKSHRATAHAEKMIKCDKCSEVFDSMSSLFSHKVNVHHEQKSLYQCPLCTYTNNNYRRIAKHLDVVHDEKPKLVCEICSKSYKTERTLLFHKIGEHGQADSRYDTQCNICNKSFSTPYYLKNHITTVHENRWRYKCDECGMGFRGKKQVETHVQVYHRNIRQFKCPKEGCDKEYGTKSQLNNHLKHARGHMENKEKQFKCSFSECSAAFVDKSDLRRHELIHINKDKKPFQCHQCGKGFTLVDYLRQHLKSCVRKDDINSNDKNALPFPT